MDCEKAQHSCCSFSTKMAFRGKCVRIWDEMSVKKQQFRSYVKDVYEIWDIYWSKNADQLSPDLKSSLFQRSKAPVLSV